MKLPAYLRGGVPLDWIVNIQQSHLETSERVPAQTSRAAQHYYPGGERPSVAAISVDPAGHNVDIEGLVSHDGDLFIQLTGIDQRRLRVAVLDTSASDARLWADPFLVPLALLGDRQTLYANWHTLGHVLIAAPLGQAAEPVLVGLAASLVARRPPSNLALLTLAAPRTLPPELVTVPHQLVPVVDPADDDAVRTVLQQLRDELDRRAAAEATAAVDVVVIVRELAGLRREHWDLCSARGPTTACACSRPVSSPPRTCSRAAQPSTSSTPVWCCKRPTRMPARRSSEHLVRRSSERAATCCCASKGERRSGRMASA
jgi:hypothetical protein